MGKDGRDKRPAGLGPPSPSPPACLSLLSFLFSITFLFFFGDRLSGFSCLSTQNSRVLSASCTPHQGPLLLFCFLVGKMEITQLWETLALSSLSLCSARLPHPCPFQDPRHTVAVLENTVSLESALSSVKLRVTQK